MIYKLNFNKQNTNMKKITIAIVLAWLGFNTQAQDLHFSQYYNSPLLLNAPWKTPLGYRGICFIRYGF